MRSQSQKMRCHLFYLRSQTLNLRCHVLMLRYHPLNLRYYVPILLSQAPCYITTIRKIVQLPYPHGSKKAVPLKIKLFVNSWLYEDDFSTQFGLKHQITKINSVGMGLLPISPDWLFSNWAWWGRYRQWCFYITCMVERRYRSDLLSGSGECLGGPIRIWK